MEVELKNQIAGSRAGGIAEAALVGLIVLVVLILFSPANTPVLPRDEGVFVYIGQGILEGKVPYRDLWDHKGPLIYYINALGLWVGQHSLWGIWLVEALMLAASLVLLYRLLRTTLGRGAALFGLLLWLAGFAIVMGGNVVEEYAVPLSVLAVVLALQRTRRAGIWLGILAGLVFMLRPNEVAGAIVALLFVLGDHLQADGRKAVIRSMLEFGGGFLLVGGGFAAYFASNHALSDLLSSVFLFNLYYVSTGGNPILSLLSGAAYLAVPALFAVAGVLAGLFAGRSPLGPDQKRLLHMGAALFIVVVPLSLLSGRVYRHYYIPWLLPLSILGSFCCVWFRTARAGSRLSRAPWVLSWFILILTVVVGVRIRIVPLLAHGAPPAEAQAVESLRTLAPAKSAIFIWGDETSYAVMAGRKLAGRYIYTSPLLMPSYGETVAAQVLADVSASRPLIIDTSGSDPAAVSLAGDAPYPYLVPLYTFVHQNYRVIGRVSGKDWTVWAPK